MRFADGFDRPDRIAFGLEGPQLAVVVGGVLIAWGLLHSPLPAALAGTLAVLVALVAAVLGAGRWAGRPLLTWAWIAARFWLSPRRGGLLLASSDDGDAPVSGSSQGPGGGDDAGGDPHRDDDDGPAWARWLRDGGARTAERDARAGLLPVEPPDAVPAPEPPTTTAPTTAEPHAPTAVEMWLTALGENRRRDGVPRSVDDTGVAGTARSQAGPPVTPPAPSAEIEPTRLGVILRRLVTRVRGGDAYPAAPPLEAEHPQAEEGRTVELDRPPLVLLPASDDATEAVDDEAAADADATPLAPVIPLLTRQDGGLDEELMLELSEGGSAPAIAERASDVVSGAPKRDNRGGHGGDRTPVFVGATRRITFFSLNGGSGRTTLATEVACLLAARGRHRPDPDGPSRRLRVALVDLDLRSSTTAVRLGIPRPTLWDYLLSTDDEPDVRRFLVEHPSGLRALLGPPKPLSTTGNAVEPARIAELVHQLEREGCHFIVFDVGSDLGAVSTWVLSQVHDIYVVITPTGSGLQDAYRTTEALRRLGLGHKLRYVVNRARGGIDVGEVMDDLGGRVVASIPYDHRLEDAENTHTIASLRGGGPAAEAIQRLARTIYPSLDGGGGRRGLWRSRAG